MCYVFFDNMYMNKKYNAIIISFDINFFQGIQIYSDVFFFNKLFDCADGHKNSSLLLSNIIIIRYRIIIIYILLLDIGIEIKRGIFMEKSLINKQKKILNSTFIFIVNDTDKNCQ